MTGLVAAFGAPEPRRVLAAARKLAPRGPAGQLRVELPGAEIVLLLDGHEASPVASRGDWTVLVIGELENLQPLRAELVGREVEATPAELAVRLVADLGVERALERLEGGVALVAWDGATLWVARDRTGLRALYVHEEPDRRWVSTDLAAFDAAAVDQVSLQQFVIHGAFVAPRAGLHGVRALAPGTLLRMGTGVEERRWAGARANPAGSGGNRARWEGAVRNAVRLATLRALEDGAVLADGGGAASTLLATEARGALRRLSLGEGPGERLRWDDEVFCAMARELWMGEPVGDPAMVAWAWLARRAADLGAPALVSGHGARELFGERRTLLRDGLGRPSPLPRLPGEESLPVDLELDALRAAAPAAPEPAQALWLARAGLLPERELRGLDLAAALQGLAGRAPFAGSLVSQVVAEVPWGLVAPRLRGRPLLSALSGVDRPHAPLLIPPSWGRSLYEDRLAERLEGWVEPDHVRALLADHRAGRDHGPRLWRLWALGRWREAMA